MNKTLGHFVLETDIPVGVSMSFTALGQRLTTQAKVDLHTGDECVIRLSDAEILVIKQGDNFIIYPAAAEHLAEDFYKGIGMKWKLTNEPGI